MKKHFLIVAFITVSSSSASAQLFTFGVKGGVPLTDPIVGSTNESRPYIVGPTIELRLPANFALEADALYQRVGTSFNFSELTGGTAISGVNSFTSSSGRLRGNNWTFPLLGKYYLPTRSTAWRPFFSMGFALREVGVHETYSYSSNAPILMTTSKTNYDSGPDVGAVAAAGIRYRTGRLSFTPEIRYTRWGSSTPWLNKNEASFLFGISF
jgi:hypothetical protein